MFDPKARTDLLNLYCEMVDFTDAAEVMAARVHLGTASFSERLRYYLKLGPSKRALESAALNREIREALPRWRSGIRPEGITIDDLRHEGETP